MRKLLRTLLALAVLGAIVFFGLTTPFGSAPAALPAHTANLANGELLYNTSGCHSCHLPTAQSGIDAALPAGGTALKTPIGILYPPNITPDPETGIGTWQAQDFVAAMRHGKGRDGYPLVPAFPYTSYAKMQDSDIRDIFAYLKSLPAVKNSSPPHETPGGALGLNLVRRGLTFWQWIGLDQQQFAVDAAQTPGWNRGAYLVNGPGHCGECHTPRTLFMTSDNRRFLAGGPHPEGEGKVPSLLDLVGRGRYKDAKDLVSAFQFGETLGYDKLSSGGMAKVQRNLAKLPEAELAAIAEYLVSLK
jgi:mono/diheme cytochrome c family protein